MSAPEIPTVMLNNGVEIPQLGFGLYKVAEADAQRVTELALEAGYRHLDTATLYGNEKSIGRAIAASGLAREDLFITTKVWNDEQGTARTSAAFERSLDWLGLDRIDLYLIHWPAPPLGLYLETWATLQKLAETGRSRAVGVSNFTEEHLDAILAAGGIPPAVNQIEVHPANQQRHLRQYCATHGIAVEAYSPLARGHAVGEERLAGIAAAHGKTIPQVILRWHLQRGSIVIPKTATPERMRENIDIFDFTLDAGSLAVLDGLDREERIGADPRVFTGI